MAPQGGIDTSMLKEYFMQVGTTREMNPGEMLIKQGQASESVFFLVEGETTLKKMNAQGVGQSIGTRAAGQVRCPLPLLLAQRSFWLDSLPAVVLLSLSADAYLAPLPYSCWVSFPFCLARCRPFLSKFLVAASSLS